MGRLRRSCKFRSRKDSRDMAVRDLFIVLKKKFCGLRQATKSWNMHFGKILRVIGFKRSQYDKSLFKYEMGDGRSVIILAYVEDMMISGRNKKDIQNIAKEISEHVEIRVEKSVYKCEGICIHHDVNTGTLTVTNPILIMTMMRRLNMEVAKDVQARITSEKRIVRDEDGYEVQETYAGMEGY